MNLLGIGSNAKTVKSDKKGEYLTAILYLAHGKTSGYQACPLASAGCLSSCLRYSGMLRMKVQTEAAKRKTKLYFEDRGTFLDMLRADIRALIRKCDRENKLPAVRLNGTSDIAFELTGIMDEFPNVQFYDYTKIPKRILTNKRPNYHLTFSLSETNGHTALEMLAKGFNVAVPFDLESGDFPETFLGYPVLNGDAHDLRFEDPPGHIVALSAKGEGKHDTSGFIVRDAMAEAYKIQRKVAA